MAEVKDRNSFHSPMQTSGTSSSMEDFAAFSQSNDCFEQDSVLASTSSTDRFASTDGSLSTTDVFDSHALASKLPRYDVDLQLPEDPEDICRAVANGTLDVSLLKSTDPIPRIYASGGGTMDSLTDASSDSSSQEPMRMEATDSLISSSNRNSGLSEDVLRDIEVSKSSGGLLSEEAMREIDRKMEEMNGEGRSSQEAWSWKLFRLQGSLRLTQQLRRSCFGGRNNLPRC